LLKIYSVQLHEKYHLVPLVSCRFVSHLDGYFGSIFSSFLVPPLTLSFPLFLFFFSISYFDPPSLPSISSLSCFYGSIYVSSTSAVRSNQLFIFQRYRTIRCVEQFHVRNYASRAISQLIGGVRKARADAYPIARYIANYAV